MIPPVDVVRIRQVLRFKDKLIGCTDTCLAMLGNAQALGGMALTEQIVRDVSGEKNPDPASPGLNQDQLVAAATALHFSYINRTGSTWAAFGQAVSARRLVIAQVWYAALGGTPIGHAVLVTGRSAKGDYIVVDPLTGTGKTFKPTVLHKAMSEFATRTGLPATKLRFGTSRPVPQKR